ncbi:unnamed protein product [Onchocerca ochengi]|uniref:Uncharacterized protein n=1 Tax=Onchocerca ochengi TaxID=42157 RepID=A0A182EWV3_ONCOC|nr:unnamed protein product [Onchocerca ochengi]
MDHYPLFDIEKVKGADGLPPIESESRFRQSLTRRPKGGDSLDRDVTKATEKQSVVTKKPDPVLEFAPCLRSRVAAKVCSFKLKLKQLMKWDLD